MSSLVENKIRYSNGSLKELLILFFPIFLTLISSHLMSFCDRYFLSLYSFDAFKAVNVASYLCIIFQELCSRVSSTNQVFVGHSLGEKKYGDIGVYTWQMIWFSCLTILLSPLFIYFGGSNYFSHIETDLLGRQYFSIMMYGNFLFPLGMALASFQVGIGKLKPLVVTSLIANLLNIGLDYLLIKGVSGILPPLGVVGAAFATLFSQGVYCILLLLLFMRHPLSERYQTKLAVFRPTFFWEVLRVGGVRIFGQPMILCAWAMGVRFVVNQGGDYLIMVSLGTTLWTLLSSFGHSLGKALTSQFSFFLGQNNWDYVWKSLRSGVMFLAGASLFLALPLVVWNEQVIQWVIKVNLEEKTLRLLSQGCFWLWIFFFLEGLTKIGTNLLISMKQTFFLFKTSFFTAFFTFLPFFWGFHKGQWSADKVWLALCPGCLFIIMVEWLKVRRFFRQKHLQVAESQL